jgi:cysteine desulfurase
MEGAFDLAGNPSSVHGFGREARAAIEAARAEVATLVHARADEVIFTSGGSEANNLAVLGAPAASLIVSSLEHDSVLAPSRARALARFEIGALPGGQINLEALEKALVEARPPALLSVMLANNETGVVQPLAEAVALARRFGALVHCDAVQAAGKIAIECANLDVDYLSLSAHKLGGPKGVGALVKRNGAGLEPLIRGGGQERSLRAGTENVGGIVGFGAAAVEAAAELERFAGLAKIRDAMEAELEGAAPDLVIFGKGAPRLPNTSCFALLGLAADTQVMALDLAGIAVSSGAACSSGKVRSSHVLAAMGVAPELAGSAIRVSFGWNSEPDDAARLIQAWRALVRRRARSAA